VKKSEFSHGTLLATLDRLGLELPLDQLQVDELGRTGRNTNSESPESPTVNNQDLIKFDKINEMNKINNSNSSTNTVIVDSICSSTLNEPVKPNG